MANPKFVIIVWMLFFKNSYSNDAILGSPFEIWNSNNYAETPNYATKKNNYLK